MREMQGAKAKVEGSLHEVNDQNRMSQATQQIAYFHMTKGELKIASQLEAHVGLSRCAVLKHQD